MHHMLLQSATVDKIFSVSKIRRPPSDTFQDQIGISDWFQSITEDSPIADLVLSRTGLRPAALGLQSIDHVGADSGMPIPAPGVRQKPINWPQSVLG